MFVVGTMFYHLVATDTSFEEYKTMGTMLQQFGKDRQLPMNLQHRMMAYLEFQYRKMSKHYGSRSISLPRTLLMRVVTCQFQKVVDTCTVRGAPLNECNPQFLTLILLNLKEVKIKSSSNSSATSLSATLFRAAYSLLNPRICFVYTPST